MFNPFTLEGKTILVTGASSGIGQSIAVIISKMGASVMITARNRQRLQTTLNLMEGKNHNVIPADLMNEEQIANLVSELPKLDGIVHCAGVGDRTFCKELNEVTYDKVLDCNLKSPVMLQTAILKRKKLQKGASIVFIASMAAKYPSVGNAAYSASKGGLISYSKCLGLELASRQIRVNCICPAMVWTDLIIQSNVTKEVLEEAQLKYPLKRYGKPEDIAYLTVYLLSDVSEWMTGSCVDISGGGEGTLI